MKKMSKKLLGVLLALTLLVGMMIPVGIQPAAAETASVDPVVTVIDFTDTSTKANGDPKTTYGFGVFRNGQNYQSYETPYIVTFEYYLPKASTVTVEYTGGWISNRSQGGASANRLQRGHHTYYETFTLEKPDSVPFVAPTLYNTAKDTVLYVWNFSVTVAGKKLSPNGNENMTNNVASSKEQTLSTYTWVKKMDIVDNTEVTTIDFSTAASYVINGVYRSKAVSDTNLFIVSFEYYMPKISSISIGGSGNAKTLSNYSYALQPGYHKFETAFTTSAASGSDAVISPRFSNDHKDTKLYIWNYSVRLQDGSSYSVNPTEGTGSNAPSTKTTGLTNFDWYDPDMYTSPSVSKFTFTSESGGAEFGLGSYTGTSNASTLYEVSFEYYLPEDVSYLEFSIPNGATTVSKTALGKTNGYHKFVWTGYYASGQSRIVPALYGSAGDTIYIWNYSVKLNGNVRSLNSAYGDWRRVAVRPDTMKCLSSYDWSKTMNMPTVTKIDFAGGDRWSKHQYLKNTQSAENPYHVTFEYYMPQQMETYFSSPGGYLSVVDGSVILKTGRHTFDAKIYTTIPSPAHRVIPTINAKTAGTLYIWNFKVTLGGVDITNDKYAAYDPTAATDSSRKLHQYPEIYDVETDTFADLPDTDKVFVIKGEDMTKEYLGSNSTNEMSILYHGSIGVNNNNKEWVFSFDYYLPEESSYYVRRANGYNAMVDDTTGSSRLQPGRHTFTCTFNAKTMYQLDGNCVPGIAFSYDPNYNYSYPNLYIWNWTLTRNAESQSPMTMLTYSSGFSGKVKDANGNYTYLDTITFGDLREIMDEDVDMATELDFSHADPDGNLVAHKSSAFTVYTTLDHVLSFDYYLPNKRSVASVYLPSNYYKVDGTSTVKNELTDSYTLTPGLGKFRSTISGMNTAQTIVRMYVNFCMGAEGDLSKLYVWNLKMVPVQKADSTDLPDDTLMSGVWIETDGVKATPNAIKASELEALAETIDCAEELNMIGAQVRTDNALRFVSGVQMSGVVRDAETGVADYSAATVMVDGVARQVVTAGTIFARESKISGLHEDALRIGNTNVYYIRAVKLQSENYHERYLGTGVEGIVFTGVITNIPKSSYGENLVARSYVIYKDAEGSDCVLYGDVVSRSIDFVNGVVGE